MIHSLDKFMGSLPAGFDGVWDWDFLYGAFGGKIMPMDIDGIVERNGRFLVFETKREGVAVPLGQMITLKALVKTGKFTVIILWGKDEPVQMQHMSSTKTSAVIPCDKESARKWAAKWFEWVNAEKGAQ